MRQGDWRDAIGHDGWFVVELRLLTPVEGGQSRDLQSGLKATWSTAGIPHPMNGPLVLAHGAKSLAPGGTATVHVHPMQPYAWAGVDPGMRLTMSKNWPRALAQGLILERVDVPRDFVPLRPVPCRREAGPGAAPAHEPA